MKNHFICATKEYATFTKNVNAPYFRKEFHLSDFHSATLKICGLGFYELFVNGKKITKGKLAPYISNPDQICCYDEYDITRLLRKSDNAIGVILGNGFINNVGGWPWDMDKAEFRSAPKFSLILYVDGKEFLYSDETFKTAPSPIFFDDLRCGEYYDANLEQVGWSDIGFDDSSWNPALKVTAPKGEFVLCEADPVRIIQEIKPIDYFKSDSGYIFDFGIDTAGICRIEFQGFTGQKLIVWHGEALLEHRVLYLKNTIVPHADINTAQKDIFICSGKKDVFEPSFTYHGFRYAYIEGIDDSQIEQLNVTLLRISSDFPETGTFHCSNEIVNKLQACAANSDRSNFVHFPTDCPQREKNGWCGDTTCSAEQMLYNFDCANSLEFYMKTIRTAQLDNGIFPCIVPDAGWGYERYHSIWGEIILVEVPYQCYRFTGNPDYLKNNADAIRKIFNHFEAIVNENGLIAYGLPDWCEPGAKFECLASTPVEVSDTLLEICACNKAIKIFELLNDTAFKNRIVSFRDKLKKRFREVWLDCASVTCRSQTGQALALAANIFTVEEEQAAVENLITLIDHDDGHFKTGNLGIRVLFDVLARYGYADLALGLITKDGFPSFKYWLDHGATSLWEGFNELYDDSILRKDGERVLSLNHHFFGHISKFFYRYILGLDVNPDLTDPDLFVLDPALLSDMEYAEGGYVRNGNGIRVSVKRKDGRVYVKPTVIGKAKYILSEHAKSYVVVED